MATDPGPAWPSLSITTSQTSLSAVQRSALHQLGYHDIPDGQLLILLHVADRTGLDPFRGEIYLAEEQRPSYDGIPDPDAPRIWSVATTIGGYRRIAHRAAVAAGEALSLRQPEWYDPDSGTWVDVWPDHDRTPAAARFTAEIQLTDGRVRHGGGIAHFSEFIRRGPDDAPTRAWTDRPCHMIGISAEGQALRHAYPDTFAGVELDLTTSTPTTRSRTPPSGSDTVEVHAASVTDLLDDPDAMQTASAHGRTAPAPVTTALDTDATPAVPEGDCPALDPGIGRRRQTALRKRLREAGHTTRAAMRNYLREHISPDLTGVADLTDPQATQLDQLLDADQTTPSRVPEVPDPAPAADPTHSSGTPTEQAR